MSLKDDNIPLADDDPQGKWAIIGCGLTYEGAQSFHIHFSFSVIIPDDSNDNYEHGKSMDSLPSIYQNDSSSSGTHSLEPDINPDEQEEKARLISQVLELQNTLDG